MQFHWWTFEHPAWLDAHEGDGGAARGGPLIRHIGVTNFDTDHLRVAGEARRADRDQPAVLLAARSPRGRRHVGASAWRTACSCWPMARSAAGSCRERWVGATEPAERIADWCKMKYRRFIDAIGGWGVLQGVLRALQSGRASGTACRSSNVATRWVLEHPAVAAVIVGARLSEREHRADNLRLFSFALDDEDRARLDEAFAGTQPHPGRLRRRIPQAALPHRGRRPQPSPRQRCRKIYGREPVPGRAGRWRVDCGSVWEPLCGYSRAVRVGERILVSGTTATHSAGAVVVPRRSRRAGRLHPRQDRRQHRGAGRHAWTTSCGPASSCATPTTGSRSARVHGRVFGDIRPANTLVRGRAPGRRSTSSRSRPRRCSSIL